MGRKKIIGKKLKINEFKRNNLRTNLGRLIIFSMCRI